MNTKERAEEHPRAVEIQAFLDEHYRRAVGSVSLITGDRASAEDAVQDALTKSWRRRGEEIEVFPAWITVVASNGARSSRRRASAERRSIERLGHRPQEVLTRDPEQIDEVLVRALGSLPLRERQAAVLFYVLDLSVRDVAIAMVVKEGTVKSLLSRARQHLAASLSTADSKGAA